MIGTPEDAVAKIEELVEASDGGFGAFLLFDHDWAPPAAKLHSYELFAQYVMPHFTGQLDGAGRVTRLGDRQRHRVHGPGRARDRQGDRGPRGGTGGQERTEVTVGLAWVTHNPVRSSPIGSGPSAPGHWRC